MNIDLKALCTQIGVSFYDEELINENNKKIYRIYIIKKEGITLKDCQNLSEIISPILDINPPCDGEYFFEVSSPGLERNLNKLEHYKLSIGENIIITTKQKEKIQGKLIKVKDENIIIKTQKEDININFNDIKKVKTFIIW